MDVTTSYRVIKEGHYSRTLKCTIAKLWIVAKYIVKYIWNDPLMVNWGHWKETWVISSFQENHGGITPERNVLMQKIKLGHFL
jgi:hypothetical protein